VRSARYGEGMEVRKIALERDDDGTLSPVEQNKLLLEQAAVGAILSIIGSNARPDVRLEAAKAALDIVGKRAPAEYAAKAAQNGPVVQFNFGPQVANVLRGLQDVQVLANATDRHTKFISKDDVIDAE